MGGGTKKVQINLTGISFTGHAKLTIYRIDSDHSNACSLNKKTEESKTNTSCGIGGDVDKAVWGAKKAAKKEGLKAVHNSLLSSGYKQNEIEFFKDTVKSCVGRSNVKECIEKSISVNSKRFTHSSAEIKRDLKKVYTKYKETHSALYYKTIDEINNLKEISLEGSKTEKIVNIADNKYTATINMEPNAIWLVILSKQIK